MTTLALFSRGNVQIPGATTWYLADLGEFRGKQELYTHQAPQRLKTLLEHALIESAVSSNRLEGVEVDPGRVRNLLAFPKPLFRDRDEEEVLKMAYQEFVERVGHIQAPRCAKTEMVMSALARLPREFTMAQLEQATPGVSREMLRHILREQKGKSIECIGRGPGAKWIKKG